MEILGYKLSNGHSIAKTNISSCNVHIKALSFYIYAEIVTFVAGSLEAGGLPGYPEVF